MSDVRHDLRHAPPGHSAFALASKWIDDTAERVDVEGVCRALGFDIETVRKVAARRALRMRLLQTGRWEEMRRAATDPSSLYFSLTAEDETAIAYFTALYMDAICLGYKANQIEGEAHG